MSTTGNVEILPNTGLWTIDPNHSIATFSVIHHGVATFRASFPKVTGSFDADAGRLAGEVPAANLLIPPIERRRTHLLSEDFLHADDFPGIAFESTSIEQAGEALTVAGRLTLRGVTREIVATGAARSPLTLQFEDGRTGQRFGINLATTIDRRDYGVAFNRDLGSGILNVGWDVTIEASLDLFRAD